MNFEQNNAIYFKGCKCNLQYLYIALLTKLGIKQDISRLYTTTFNNVYYVEHIAKTND